MKGSTLASRPHAVICSFCEAGELFFLGDDSTRCTTCGGHLGRALLEALREIGEILRNPFMEVLEQAS